MPLQDAPWELNEWKWIPDGKYLVTSKWSERRTIPSMVQVRMVGWYLMKYEDEMRETQHTTHTHNIIYIWQKKHHVTFASITWSIRRREEVLIKLGHELNGTANVFIFFFLFKCLAWSLFNLVSSRYFDPKMQKKDFDHLKAVTLIVSIDDDIGIYLMVSLITTTPSLTEGHQERIKTTILLSSTITSTFSKSKFDS